MNPGLWRSCGILIAGVILTLTTTQFEAPVVLDFYRNPWPEFRNFMANSFFEGRPFGGSDIGVTLALIAFAIWIYQRSQRKSDAPSIAAKLKFLWLTGLLTAICGVHSLKWIVSRARPKVILTPDTQVDTMINLTWPGFMPWDGPRGLDWNSFPSGHTASCAIMIAYAYLVWPKHRAAGITVFVAVTIYCGLMAIARSMAGMHWLSDSVASFFLAWFIIDMVARRLGIIESPTS